MPAFSYKERFVPFIKDFSKTGTIRSFRKYLIKSGQISMHYFGMRTKYCTKLIENQKIKSVWTIFIYKDGSVYMSYQTLTRNESYNLLKSRRKLAQKALQLTDSQKDRLAWTDGFRDQNNPYVKKGSFERMIRFWRLTHDLPFTGQYIKCR